MKEIMEKMAQKIDKTLRMFDNNLGFTLLIFDFNHPSVCNYVSNAERQDMIKTLREMATRLELSQDMPPSIGSA
jgi:hypothetical protein